MKKAEVRKCVLKWMTESDMSLLNEFEVRPMRPENKVKKLSDEIANLRNGLETTHAKLDKIFAL